VVTSETLCKALPSIHHTYHIKSKNILHHPLITEIHTQTIQNTTQDFTYKSLLTKNIQPKTTQTISLPTVKPAPNLSFYDICQKRTSPGMKFSLKPITKEQLATILQTATEQIVYTNDISQRMDHNELFIAGYFHHIEGTPHGIYIYDPAKNTLKLLRTGDFRVYLQRATLEPHINLYQVPICLHLFGNPIYQKETLDARGYRISQMQTGILVQRLALAASRIGFGAHPLLGFDTKMVDSLYSFDSNIYRSLIQIPIGPFQSANSWEGVLKM
jgi:SagB-type dehydrogenase family enzyme